MKNMKSSDHNNLLQQNISVDLQVALDESSALKSQVPSLQQFESWVSEVFNFIKRTNDAEVSIRVVDLTEMATLNETYRQKSGPTNVLSFPFSAPEEVDSALLGDVLLGDIAICLPVIIQESSNQEKKVIDHWAHIVIHGTLHLLGYDHVSTRQAEKMEAMEIAILDFLR